MKATLRQSPRSGQPLAVGGNNTCGGTKDPGYLIDMPLSGHCLPSKGLLGPGAYQNLEAFLAALQGKERRFMVIGIS